MRFFDGLARTDYQDLLRALGAECDRAGVRDLRLIETADGLLLQCRIAGQLSSGFQVVHYDDDALMELLQDAYTRRGLRAVETTPFPPLGLSYQQMLRGVGRALDQAELHYLRLIEQPDAIHIQANGGTLRRGFHTYHLDTERLYTLVEATATNGVAALGPPLG
jgi:hypothetical protein